MDQPLSEGRPSEAVGSLQRGLAVMETLAAHPGGLTLTETAGALGLTRAGARRLLLTLAASGYALQDGRRFRLTPRLLTVARSWLQDAGPWAHAEPIMRELAGRLQEACSAAALSGGDVVYLARVPGRRIVSVALAVGSRLPAWCTSMGRVLLADLSPEALAAHLAAADIRPLTPKSLTDRAALAAEIRRCGAQGYALVDEELELGLRSIAAPIRDRAGRTTAALNVSTQASRFTPAEMEAEILPSLRAAARRIEAYFALE